MPSDSGPDDEPIDMRHIEDQIDQEYVDRLRKLGEYAKDIVWSDEDWDLLRRYHAADLAPYAPLSEEDLFIMGTRIDFNDESEIKRLKIGSEWEPTIPSDDTILRRYMTFDKFISLLMKNGFWFSNINNFPDHFEATISEPSANHIQDLVEFEKDGENSGHISFNIEKRRERNEHTYVSCWRMGGDESSIFWDAYVGDGNGLAIQTTVGKLKQHLEEDLWNGYIDRLIEEGLDGVWSEYQNLLAGNVEYLEYESDPISNSHISPARYFHKRNGFQDEREFRLVKTPLPLIDMSEFPDPKPGIVVSGDLEEIIDKIIFPPGKHGLYKDLVSDLAITLDADVEQSALEKDPNSVEL